LKGIEGLDRAVQSSLDDVEICDTSTYDATDLPSFDFDVNSSTTQTYVAPTSWYKVLMISDLADAIATYLQEGTFAETSDVGLFIATTRQAAFHSRRTFPPFLLLRELTNSTPNRRYPPITRHDGI
jgi:hypothetical protein